MKNFFGNVASPFPEAPESASDRPRGLLTIRPTNATIVWLKRNAQAIIMDNSNY